MGPSKNKNRMTAGRLRRQAEARLRERAESPLPPRTNEEAQRLVHELEVHQIELEMQNTELLRAREELEASRDRYAELYDFAPVGYFSFDEHGLIRQVNLAGARLLGLDRRQLPRKPFSHFIADAASREIFAAHLATVLRQPGFHQCEIKLARRDGAVLHALVQSVSGNPDESGADIILTSVTDGTVHQQLAEALRSAQTRLEATVKERTDELSRTNARLLREIELHQQTEVSLKRALAEIQQLSDRLKDENIQLQRVVARDYKSREIIGRSTALAYVFFRVEQVAPQDTTVLLLGETGSGKGLIARAIHSQSKRKDRPMVTVNCTALPANLIESELFGREKGAFTGADARQMGRFELADGGTIFLDEIGEMPLELQCKLLRVIQDGEFERLGSPRTIKVNVRIIAASNRNLEEEIRAGRFREDLFYRLSVFPITIPPLRQRPEDIPLLVDHFVAKYNKKIGRRITTVPQETLDALQKYPWPGNVRELESVIERAVITSTGDTLQVLDRFDTFRQTEASAGDEVKALAELERDHIFQVLQQTGWRIEGKNGAALLLGLNPSTLRARMRKLGIRRQ